MFTGLIEEMGLVTKLDRGIESARIEIEGDKIFANLVTGGSIAVNGVCLTAFEINDKKFLADLSSQTLQVTSLSELKEGDRVNLERPVTFGSAMGGHFVQGHVDGTARLSARSPGEGWENVSFELPKSLMEFIVDKGSITVDGVSLTVAQLNDSASTITVALIPETLEMTTLGALAVGAKVNIEVDVLGKYVARAVAVRMEGQDGK